MSKTRIVSQYQGNELVAKYLSIAVASGITGADSSHISKVARNKRKAAGGFGWKYGRGGLTLGSNTIQQVDKTTGEVIAVYDSLDTASKLTGLTMTRIEKVLLGENRVAGGFLWTYTV